MLRMDALRRFRPHKIEPSSHGVFGLRRCSLAFMISLMSPTGRISKMLPNVSAGCCPISLYSIVFAKLLIDGVPGG